jgi:competence protein ComEC
LWARAPAIGAAATIAIAGVVAGYLASWLAVGALAVGVAAMAAGEWGSASGAGGSCGADVVRGRAGPTWIVVAALVGVRLLVVVDHARDDARAWADAAAGGEPVAVRATARIESLRESGEGRWSVRATLSCPPPCEGAVVRWSWRGETPPRAGDRIALAGQLLPEPPRASPGGLFPPPGLGPGARRGTLRDVEVLRTAPSAMPALAAAERHLRERIAARFGAELAPLLTALLLGDRQELDGELSDAFARTGTIHILSVSGLHVVFLAELLAFALGLARLGPRARAGASTALLAAYAALVGALPSAVRAAVMASLAMWARAGERRVDPWQLLGVAAVGLLAWRPGDLFDLGFVLSFASVAGLLALVIPLERWLASGGPGGDRPMRPVAFLAAGLAATTAATVATLPIQAAAFGWLAPVGFLLNPAAVPLAGIGLPLAWLALGADALGLTFVADPLARAASASLGLLGALVAGLGAHARPWVPGPWGWAVAAAAGGVVALALGRRRPGPGIAIAALAVAVALAARGPAPAVLEIVWLDVGQGDAIVLHFPDGGTWLVDAGPADPFGDAGRRVVLPYLRRRGVRHLDRFVTTHPDLDHVGGAATVARGINVRAWSGGGPVDDGPAWLALLASEDLRPEQVRAGDRLRQGDVTVDVLHPGAGWLAADPYAARLGPNEASVVLLVGLGRCRALLTGDIGVPAETELVEALGDSLRAELLHAGHHGSRHSSSSAFLASVRPRDVVVSAGRGNRHGHPHPDALGRFAAGDARVWRTDRMGTVTARCGAAGWHLATAGVYLR